MICLSKRISVGFMAFSTICTPDCPHKSDGCKSESVTLESDVSYREGDKIYTIRAGFCFDGASIPKAVWSLIGHPLYPAYVRAALFHDAMYHSHAMSREQADKSFYELLKTDGVSWLRREQMYNAVRLFGASSYNVGDAVVSHWSKFVTVETAQ